MQADPGVDASGSATEIGEAGSEDDQDRQGLDEPMPQAEAEPDDENRRRLAERLEQEEAEAPEGQLLDDRPDHCECEQVDGEGEGMAWVPARRRQSLLPAAVQDGIQDRVR